MFENYLTSSELVLFWNGESIDKAMMFSDFQATLDGFVGISSYAGELKHAAYVQLDEALNVRACVLFNMGFDSSGFPDRSWNLPLRHMTEIAGRGPDMGGGAISLVCRSQCPISWHAPALWDPVLQPADKHSFTQISAAVKTACDRFSLRPTRAAAVQATFTQDNINTQTDTDADIPMLMDEAPEPLLMPEAAPQWAQERENLMSLVAEQQLHISTLTTEKNEVVAQLLFTHKQQVDILESQNSRLLSQHKAAKVQSDEQREEIDVLRLQIASMHDLEGNLAEERRLHEEQLADIMHAKAGEEAQKFEHLLHQKDLEIASREARLKSEYQLSIEQRLAEEASSFRLQINSLRAELNYREDELAAVHKELAELSASIAQRGQSAADEFLLKLESLGMNFVVFHAGVGHVSVALNELAAYVSNPMGFAALKCLVSEDQYRVWCAHHENPRCNAPMGDKCCDARLIRTDSPTKFVIGQSDRCARHQSADTAIDNVLRFR